jgi:hypothetical protein
MLPENPKSGMFLLILELSRSKTMRVIKKELVETVKTKKDL